MLRDDRASSSFAHTCSGDMYVTLPSMSSGLLTRSPDDTVVRDRLSDKRPKMVGPQLERVNSRKNLPKGLKASWI